MFQGQRLSRICFSISQKWDAMKSVKLPYRSENTVPRSILARKRRIACSRPKDSVLIIPRSKSRSSLFPSSWERRRSAAKFDSSTRTAPPERRFDMSLGLNLFTTCLLQTITICLSLISEALPYKIVFQLWETLEMFHAKQDQRSQLFALKVPDTLKCKIVKRR